MDRSFVGSKGRDGLRAGVGSPRLHQCEHLMECRRLFSNPDARTLAIVLVRVILRGRLRRIELVPMKLHITMSCPNRILMHATGQSMRICGKETAQEPTTFARWTEGVHSVRIDRVSGARHDIDNRGVVPRTEEPRARTLVLRTLSALGKISSQRKT